MFSENNEIEEEDILAEPDEITTDSVTGFAKVISYLPCNPWIILILSIALYYLWKNKLSGLYEKWRESRKDEEADLKKNSDLFAERERARLVAIEAFQRNYNAQAVLIQEKMKAREEKKREELIARYSASESPGRKLTEDYSPLTGRGGPSYRPPRRNNSGCCGNT